MYGIFIYHKKKMNESLCEYRDTEEEALKLAKEWEIFCNIANSDKGESISQLDIDDDFDYIEVWKQEENGMYGNGGEPILHIGLN